MSVEVGVVGLTYARDSVDPTLKHSQDMVYVAANWTPAGHQTRERNGLRLKWRPEAISVRFGVGLADLTTGPATSILPFGWDVEYGLGVAGGVAWMPFQAPSYSIGIDLADHVAFFSWPRPRHGISIGLALRLEAP